MTELLTAKLPPSEADSTFASARRARAEELLRYIRALDLLCNSARGTRLEIQGRTLLPAREIFIDMLAAAGEPLLLDVFPKPEPLQGKKTVG